MRTRSITLLIVTLFLLSACGFGKPSADEPIIPKPRSGPPVIDLRPVFADFTEGDTGKGRSAILFFARKGDRFSDASEKALRAAYGSGGVKLSTFRVNFDTATGAKLALNVFLPDTFVLLGPKGERVGSILHPTPDELAVLLRSGTSLR